MYCGGLNSISPDSSLEAYNFFKLWIYYIKDRENVIP